MGYRIIYDEESKSTRSRIPILTLGFFLLFLAGFLALRQPAVFWPKGFETIAGSILEGGGIWEAIECFCIELVSHG